MYNSGIKVFITHRLNVLQKPEADFKEFTLVKIQTQVEDVEKYITQQLEGDENVKRLSETFKTRIINEVRDQAKDM
jgi:hypothetical protein